MGLFSFVGKDATDGAVKRIGETLAGLDTAKLNSELMKFGEQIPILGILLKGYNAMTPEEQAEFAKNIMLAGAKMAAKA